MRRRGGPALALALAVFVCLHLRVLAGRRGGFLGLGSTSRFRFAFGGVNTAGNEETERKQETMLGSGPDSDVLLDVGVSSALHTPTARADLVDLCRREKACTGRLTESPAVGDVQRLLMPQGPAGGPSPRLDELAGAAAVRRARQAGAGAGALAAGRRDADADARVNVSLSLYSGYRHTPPLIPSL